MATALLTRLSCSSSSEGSLVTWQKAFRPSDMGRVVKRNLSTLELLGSSQESSVVDALNRSEKRVFELPHSVLIASSMATQRACVYVVCVCLVKETLNILNTIFYLKRY